MPAPSEGYASVAHGIYAGISPEKYAGTNKGRVAFITGASKGLGLASAKAFAASGASLFISARSIGALEKIRDELEQTYKVPVAAFPIDVKSEESVKACVAKAVETYGKIDIVISNAGGGEADGAIGDVSVDLWWDCIELNLKGTYSVATHTIAELRKTKGYFILLSSVLAHIRIPGGSAYNMAKLTLVRLAEWLHIENAQYGVKAISFHPGGVATDLSAKVLVTNPQLASFFQDSPELEAWTEVRLCSGTEDWLSGRYIDSTWGLDEIAKLKEAVLEDDALKLRLALPHSK